MFANIEQLIMLLRERGHRITTPRRWMLKVMLDEAHHMTVEEIGQKLDEHGIHIDEATIYRTLQWLKQNRLVAQMTLGSGADVYSLLDDQRHHHLICVECETVLELDDTFFAPMREAIREQYGFVPHIDHYAIFGLCADCHAVRNFTRESDRADQTRSRD